ncbi:aldehyde dehydrogenase family protein [Loigolactobacillus zhaoyuanensis]|uniref:Aldehyde dehydrogenase family protein n=1 Tax=Loigolactobacillus zhaoyuanensis TaxID=2486017 RepID=A0ABW8UGT4_9LACO
MQFIDKDLLSISEARILSDAAKSNQNNLASYSQTELDKAVMAIFKVIAEHGETMLSQEVDGSNYGNLQDKMQLLTDFMNKLATYLQDKKYVGILSTDTDQNIQTVGVSRGVVGVVMSALNPVLNTCYAAIIAIKSGNSLVIAPHTKTTAVVNSISDMLSQAIEDAGLPHGTISCMKKIAVDGINELITNKNIDVVVNLGCPEYLEINPVGGKSVLYCGTGFSPVFIEKSADIKAAVATVIASRSYDNGILPAAEQFIITESVIANKVRYELGEQGAYFMSADDETKLLALIGSVDQPTYEANIGKSAKYLANRAGFTVPDKTKVLVTTQEYIFDESPYCNEMSFPILAFYLEPDWLRACEKCMALLKNKHHGHTLVIHSNNQKIIREFALKKPVARVIVNGAATFSSFGLDSDLTPSFWLGGLTSAGGSAANSITPADLTYVRQIGYPAVTSILSGQNTTQEDSTDIKIQDNFLNLLKQLTNEMK